MAKIFNNQTTNGVSAQFKCFGVRNVVNLYIAGSLGGGTITVEAETPDSTAWVPLAGGTISTPGLHVISAAPFVSRLSLAGSTGANVSAWVEIDDFVSRDRVIEE